MTKVTNKKDKAFVIPESGRPIDLDLETVTTVEDADRVILWLTDVIKDMDRQISETESPDAAWLRKVRSARWWAAHIRHKAREVRDKFSPELTVRQAVSSVLLDFLDDDLIDELEELLAERFPHLTGVYLRDALK